MLYIVASYTGFRRNALGSVTVRSFDFASEPPTLTVPGRLLEATADGRLAESVEDRPEGDRDLRMEAILRATETALEANVETSDVSRAARRFAADAGALADTLRRSGALGRGVRRRSDVDRCRGVRPAGDGRDD